MIEFLTWLSARRRTYDEAMAAWQSHCPRQTIWEDAVIEGLVETEAGATPEDTEVRLTPRGRAMLDAQNGTSIPHPTIQTRLAS